MNTLIPPGGRIATAIVVMQPGTGNVLAMAVNRTYGDTTDHLPVYGKDPKTGKIGREHGPLTHQIQLATSYPGLPGRFDVQDVHARRGAGKGPFDLDRLLFAGLHLPDQFR